MNHNHAEVAIEGPTTTHYSSETDIATTARAWRISLTGPADFVEEMLASTARIVAGMQDGPVEEAERTDEIRKAALMWSAFRRGAWTTEDQTRAETELARLREELEALRVERDKDGD